MNKQTVYEADGMGRRIAKYRRFCGYATAADLARAIENPRITTATIANIESGRRADVSVMQLIEIASALGISPLLLLTDVFAPFAKPEIRGLTKDAAKANNSDLLNWFALEAPTIGHDGEAATEIWSLVTSFKTLRSRTEKVSKIVEELNGLRRNGLQSRNAYKALAYELQVNLFALEGAYLKLKNHELVDLSWFDPSVIGLIEREFDFEPPVFGREGD